MAPLALSANPLALALRVPATRIRAIIRNEQPPVVTPTRRSASRTTSGPAPSSGSTSRPPTSCPLTVAEVGARIEQEVRPRAV
jgi:hypothetical protein